MLQSKDWVKTGYANGVPMGGDLPAPKAKAPTFIVWAVKDPDDANLDRIQIVKGWTQERTDLREDLRRRVVAARRTRRSPERWCAGQGELPPVGNTVDVKNATYTNTIGAVELKTVWTDPDFDPSQHALLLRTRAADPDAALDDVRREEAGRSAAEQRARDGAGARLDFADLVFAERRSAQGREAGHDGRRLAAKGRRGAGRRAAEAADRRQDLQGPQHGDGTALRDPLRRWTAGA